MSNSYTMEYGFPSLIYPERMFKTREDAVAFDAVESENLMLGPYFTRPRIESIANGTVQDADKDNCRAVLAALRWTVNAADDAENEKRMAEWRKKKESTAVAQAAEF